ncbi:hypothetical protein [Pectobacterium versatile]|uniref:hypothetical protein n=1 Tax=Pectobacterium versatile TaxID=2488639 RepID=UPI001CF36C5A|nr:hypothetical protein [Pectobacterium versatile]MCA6924719.1 hypothetical protein [Pectobacterium versatile]MCH5081483.1 hypothetical protein [Pectobacterium versatile]
MRNSLYNINGIYSIIREYYIANFPYKIEFKAEDVLNAHIQSKNENACIVQNGTKYEFQNPTPYQLSNEAFARSFETGIVYLEEYLAEENNLVSIFNDLHIFNSWLVDSGFIKNGVATEKMLVTKTL